MRRSKTVVVNLDMKELEMELRAGHVCKGCLKTSKDLDGVWPALQTHSIPEAVQLTLTSVSHAKIIPNLFRVPHSGTNVNVNLGITNRDLGGTLKH